MILGYNTNGFAHHDLAGAMTILSELGYRSAAVTLERSLLDPPNDLGVDRAVALLAPIVEATGMRVTIETGSRFILDPRRKHQPTLLSADAAARDRRIAFLMAAIDVAAGVGADCVSLWSGTPDDEAEEDEHYDRLAEAMTAVLHHAATKDVRLAFEPEPGMFIDTMARFEHLFKRLEHPLFGLTLDVGHIHCQSDGDPGEHMRCWQHVLWNVHIEDMRRGVHDHLMFGEGDMDFEVVFAALRAAQYAGPAHVELSRHSHDAVETARRSYEFLSRYV